MVMQMTAIQSMTDMNMVYLDVSAGVTGLILATLVLKGLDVFDYTKLNYVIIPMILIARLIVDFGYHTFVSQTDMFGGSLQEFILSIIVWGVLMKYVLPYVIKYFKLPFARPTDKEIAVILACSVIMMFAIARLTHWG